MTTSALHSDLTVAHFHPNVTDVRLTRQRINRHSLCLRFRDVRTGKTVSIVSSWDVLVAQLSEALDDFVMSAP